MHKNAPIPYQGESVMNFITFGDTSQIPLKHPYTGPIFQGNETFLPPVFGRFHVYDYGFILDFEFVRFCKVHIPHTTPKGAP